MKLNLAYDNQVGLNDLVSNESTLVDDLGVSKEDAKRLANLELSNSVTVDTTLIAKDYILMLRGLNDKLKPERITLEFLGLSYCDPIFSEVLIGKEPKLECELVLLYEKSSGIYEVSEDYDDAYSLFKEFGKIISKYVDCVIKVETNDEFDDDYGDHDYSYY